MRTTPLSRTCFHRAVRCALALVLASWVAAHAEASGELAQYVAKPDPSYSWREVGSGHLGSGTCLELILTSQTWRGTPWKHQLLIFRPDRIDTSSKQALLFIDGGRWRTEYESGHPEVPPEARVFTRLAESIRAPVAVVRQVPFQPLFDRREDALIAYTFDQYLQTGETDWPLLLPMVKSAVRAMDAVQEVAHERWHSPIERFTVTGASKRGWTSWLTAASDPRVASVAPMVIDMLNMPAQIRLQHATFGGLSERVQDYADIDLPARMDSDLGRSLIAMVDPFSYRASLTQPKLIVLGTNDRYWPLDALSQYWPGLSEPKSVLYVPNQGHGLRDVDRVIGSLSALHRYSSHNEPLPQLTWKFSSANNRLELDVHPNRKARRVTAWTANSPTRDFRDAHWDDHHCKPAKSGFQCSEPMSADGYTAMYTEVAFKDHGSPAFSLSTSVCIADGRVVGAPQCVTEAGTAPAPPERRLSFEATPGLE